MKSLEIVNSCLYIIDYNRRQMSEEELLMNIDGYFVKENELQQIKQDLEVLEMIKKGIVTYQNKFVTAIEVICAMFDFNEEEYNKLKQWLEGNE